MIIYFIDGFFILVMLGAVIALVFGIADSIFSFIKGLSIVIKYLFGFALAILLGFLHIYVISHLKNKKYIIHFIMLIILDIAIFIFLSTAYQHEEEERFQVMNTYSKAAYESVYDYIENLKNQGIPLEEIISDKYFEKTNSENGFTIYKQIWFTSKTTGDSLINNKLCLSAKKTSLVVYIGITEIDNQKEYFIQVKEAKNPKMIGQYPTQISYENRGKVTWKEYYTD